MADIVIRCMKIPTVCIDNGWYGNCPMDRLWCAQRFAPKDSTDGSAHKEQWNKLPSWCPLVPLPEEHGRLIDADNLDVDEVYTTEYGFQRVVWADLIDSATTIVPAEEGADDGT